MAQTPITINSSDMPVVGDTLRYSTAGTTGLNASTISTNTGANYTWNFSNLVPTDQLLQSFKSSSATPYLLYFAGMVGYKRADSISLGPITQKNVWDFYKTVATKYTIEGTGFSVSGIPLASDYSDPDELYNFPLNYADIDSGTFSVSTSIPTLGSLTQAGKRKNIVDGWGKITTPFGTFDAIRVRSIVTETDTIKIVTPFPFTLPFPNNRVEYRWLAKGVHIPMLEIVVNNGVTISSVKYRDQYHYIPVTPAANFTANNVYPKINDIVKITDASTDIPTRWKWTITPATYTFANGTNDTLQNIEVKFTANGNYTIALRAQNLAGFNVATKTAYIKVGDVPVVKFGADKKNANIANVVSFADSSSNFPSRWKWTILPSTYSFNSGSMDTLKSIQVLFNKGGFYTVDLKVTNPWGSDQATKSNYVWINFPAGIATQGCKNVQVFPSPVSDKLSFIFPSVESGIITIYNALGEKIKVEDVRNSNTILVNDLTPGIYIIEGSVGSQIFRARFVKK